MLSEFLQFGYLGLLGLLITLCYKIVAITERKDRYLKHTLTLLGVFSAIAFIGGGAGYIWASKELEVVQAKESLDNIKKIQVSELRQAHKTELEPLQKALADTVRSLELSALNSTRNEHLEEISRLNDLIKSRKESNAAEIKAVASVFNETIPKT